MSNSTTHVRTSNGKVINVSKANLDSFAHNYKQTANILEKVKTAQKVYGDKIENVRKLEKNLQVAKMNKEKARRELLSIQNEQSRKQKANMKILKNVYKTNGTVAKKSLSNYGRDVKSYGKTLYSRMKMPSNPFRKRLV